MAVITRTQHVQFDTVNMLAVQGSGTGKFKSSGQPGTLRSDFGVVLTGKVRITKSSNAGGYFIVRTGVSPKGTDRRRTFFRGTAKVAGVGMGVETLDDYWNLLVLVERLGL